MKLLRELTDALFKWGLIIILIATYWMVVPYLDSIHHQVAYVETEVSMVLEGQKALYTQIAKCIVREVETKQDLANFVKASTKQEIARTEALITVIEQYEVIKKYIDERFKVTDVNSQLFKTQINAQLTDVQKGLKAIVKKEEMKEFFTTYTEYTITQVVVKVENDTLDSFGSGSVLSYGGKFYILTAAHLVDSNTDHLVLSENGKTIGDLEIVKKDVDTDLMLLKLTDPELVPSYVTTLANREPTKFEDLYLCGNPNGVEDLLSRGRAVLYTKDVMYVQDHCYFGSSGGGVFNKNGELVGVISFMHTSDPTPMGIVARRKPMFILDGIVRLNTIKEFLKDIS